MLRTASATTVALFFRTTKPGDKLVGSFLSNYPDQLKTSLAKVPGLKVTSSARVTAAEFIKYEESPQESFVSGRLINEIISAQTVLRLVG